MSVGPRCPYQGPPDALHCVLLCGSLLETHALHFASSPVAIIWDVFRLSSLAMGSVAERGHTECAPPRPPRHRPLCSRIPVGGDRHICARRAHGVRGSGFVDLAACQDPPSSFNHIFHVPLFPGLLGNGPRLSASSRLSRVHENAFRVHSTISGLRVL